MHEDTVLILLEWFLVKTMDYLALLVCRCYSHVYNHDQF